MRIRIKRNSKTKFFSFTDLWGFTQVLGKEENSSIKLLSTLFGCLFDRQKKQDVYKNTTANTLLT